MTALVWFTAFLSSVVITGGIRRVNVMTWKDNRPSWILVYTGMAYFAGAVALDAFHHWDVEPHDVVIMMVLSVHMIITRHLWANGAAPATKKQAL